MAVPPAPEATAGPQPADWTPLLPRSARVRAVRAETDDTVTLTLDPGAPLAFAPGQFTMLYGFATGEVPISVSGDPARPEELVHTIRAVGAATRALCALEPGDTLGVRGPFGSGWPVDAARGCDVVLAAGGIGLAPLRPVLYALLARRADYGRVVLLYGGRTPRDLLFRDELDGWAARPDVEVHVTVDAASPAWRGEVGTVTTLLPRLPALGRDAVAMTCGPEVMMRFTAQGLLRLGLEPARMFLSMERNMRCAVGHCGHCQLGPLFMCKDGPVFSYPRLARLMEVHQL